MVLNSLSLYLEACRCTLTAENCVLDAKWHEHYISVLTNLRHSLSCRVCGFLLKIPTGPISTQCGHYFCKKCVGLKPKYIINTCAWCHDIKRYSINTELSIIVRCFISLCKFVIDLRKRLFMQLTSINYLLDEALLYDKNNTEINESIQIPIVDIKPTETTKIKKYIKKSKNKKHKKHSIMPNLTKLDKISDMSTKSVNELINTRTVDEDIGPPNLVKEIKYDCIHIAEHDYNLPQFNGYDSSLKDEPISEPSSPILIASVEKSNSAGQTSIEQPITSPIIVKDLNASPIVLNTVRTTGLRSGNCFKDIIQGCRCAIVSRRPGNLTCCGQRCPCYSNFKGCGNLCKCQGCRNTRGESSHESLKPFFNFQLVNNSNNCLNVMQTCVNI